MACKTFYFAGGGTGGHIYPSIAVAQKICELEPSARIHFFCSNREIDAQILSHSGFEYTRLPALALKLASKKPISFFTSLIKSYKTAKQSFSDADNSIVTATGGFVSVPVCLAALKSKIPVKILNVDILPGRANKLLGYFADQIYVQFQETADYFKKAKAQVVGCPLRRGFDNPKPEKAKEQLGLDENKKILLVTGASSGSENINNVICSLLEKLNSFSKDWQIVHITGRTNLEKVKQIYSAALINHKVLSFYDDMPNLLATADLVVGRSGAVSVAEYAALGVPSICMPYPYHRDRHQYLNAGKLVEAGAAIIVDDLPDSITTSQALFKELNDLMANEEKRKKMKKSCEIIVNRKAALKIAELLLKNM